MAEIESYILSIHQYVASQNIRKTGLAGRSVSNKKEVVRGECVVVPQVSDLSSELNLDGKILVTTMTTPEFVPYIGKIKGIVTDNGGLLCHAAIISRELGIPCIVGTEAATTYFQTGGIIELDAEKGMVVIIED